MPKLFKENFLLILLGIVTVLTFWDLPKTFYQQDEWQTLGHFLAQGASNIFKYTTPLESIFGEGRPLSRIFYLIFLTNFKFTVIPIAVFAIFNQIVNVFLVFFLTNKVSKNYFIAFFASLFFAVSSVSHQAVTWSAAVTTLPATTLILLSVISYIVFLDNGNKKFLYLSFLLGLISLFFKEVGLFLFILLPLIFIIYKKKISIKSIFYTHLPLLIYGFLLLVFRISELFFNTQKVAGFVQGGQNFTQSVLLHLILYPLTSLFQVFVPPLDLYSITPAITKMQYKFLVGSPLIDLIAQSIVADMVSILGSMIVLGLLALIAYKYKDKITKRNILFALAFFFLSFLPYAVLHRESSYLSSRYFYVGAIGAGILFGYVIYFLTNFNKYLKWGVLFLVFLYLFHHASIIRNDIDYQVKLGNERKTVLNGIRELKPTLDNKTVFYVTSDKEYYGPITNPFQNGLGYVLEVWYYDSGKIPKEFLSENFLWDLGTEGYKELGDKGFGYFQDIDKMVAEIQKNKLKADIAHAFFIRSSDSKVLDITSEIRARISTISAAEK